MTNHKEALANLESREAKVAYAIKHKLRVSVRPTRDRHRFVFRIVTPDRQVLDTFDCSRANYARISRAGADMDKISNEPVRRWRLYETASGNSPVRDYLLTLTEDEQSRVRAKMHIIKTQGLSKAIRMAAEKSDLYEIHADASNRALRLIFAPEGKRGHVLLGLNAFEKRSQKTPRSAIDTALARLADWRERHEKRRRTSSLGRVSARR
jgi:phage-related protein